MAKIHHNTVKKATAHGVSIEFAPETNTYGAYVITTRQHLATANDPKDALDLAIAAIAPAKIARTAKPKKSTKKRKPAAEDGEEGDEEEGGDKSVIKAKYKEKYKPHQMTCGDDLAAKLTKYATVEVKGKPPHVSVDLLEKLGRANDVWSPKWRSLRDRSGNVAVGMIRMNLGNRLRGLARNDKTIKWPS